MHMRFPILLTMFTAIASIYTGPCIAGGICYPSDAEKVLLPRYCAEWYKKLMSSLPGGVVGMSHFCEGLTCLNRARQEFSSVGRRKEWLNWGIGEMSYAISHTDAHAPSQAVLKTGRAEARFLLGLEQAAMEDINGAIAVNPKHLNSYLVAYNYYKHQKNYKRAIEILDQGLAASPGAKPLLTRKQRLEKKLQENSAP